MYIGEEIRISKSCRLDGTEVYQFSRWLDGKPHEQYRPMSKEEAFVGVIQILSNFEPSRIHHHLDKLTTDAGN